jgi:hypothetical protein
MVPSLLVTTLVFVLLENVISVNERFLSALGGLW